MDSRYPDAAIKHVSLEEMGRELEAYRREMPTIQGELYATAKNRAPFNKVIRHTLSSRYPLKQANDLCQVLLEKWAEPLAAIAGFQGMDIHPSYLKLSYKYLIQNHPHDSICGCSVDQVHKDMDYRFDQAALIANQAVSDALKFEQAW